jgi:hypothetical protein
MGIPYFIAKGLTLGKGVVTRGSVRVRQHVPDRVGTSQLCSWRSTRTTCGSDGSNDQPLRLMLLFAFFVSLIFATIAKDTPASRRDSARRCSRCSSAPRSSSAG